MRAIFMGACLLLGCRPQPIQPATKTTVAFSPPTIFTDSSMYRAVCREADSIEKLIPIPRKCTPRDQRVRIF